MSQPLIPLADIEEKSFMDSAKSVSGGVQPLSELNIQSIRSTISTLKQLQSTGSASTSGEILCAPSTYTIAILHGSKNKGATAPNDLNLACIQSLVVAAHNLANANACSSVLAGQSSESDEFGDVGLYIAVPKGHLEQVEDATDEVEKTKRVLSLLGLDGVLSSGSQGQIKPLSLFASTGLPTTFQVSSSSFPALSTFLDLTADKLKLSDRFAFTLDTQKNGVVVHVLMGKLNADQEDKEKDKDNVIWAGLLGVGIWS